MEVVVCEAYIKREEIKVLGQSRSSLKQLATVLSQPRHKPGQLST